MAAPASPPRAMRGALGGTSEQAWYWPRSASTPAKNAASSADSACLDDVAVASAATEEADEDFVDDLLRRVADLARIASRPSRTQAPRGCRAAKSAEANTSVEEGAGTGSTFTNGSLEVLRLQRENAALLLQLRAMETECCLLRQKALEFEATHEAALTNWNKDMLQLNVVQTRELKQLRENDGLHRALQARAAEVAGLRRALAASERRGMLEAPSDSAGGSKPEPSRTAESDFSTLEPALLECERCGHRFQVEYAVVPVPPDAEASEKRSNDAHLYSRLDEECRAVLQRLFPAGMKPSTLLAESVQLSDTSGARGNSDTSGSHSGGFGAAGARARQELRQHSMPPRRVPAQQCMQLADAGASDATGSHSSLVPLQSRATLPHQAGQRHVSDGRLRVCDGSLHTDPGIVHAASAPGSHQLLSSRYRPMSPNLDFRCLNDGSAVTDPGGTVAVYAPPRRLASPRTPSRVVHKPKLAPDILVYRGSPARHQTPPPSPCLGFLRGAVTRTVRASTPPSPSLRGRGLAAPPPPSLRRSLPAERLRWTGSSPSFGEGSGPHSRSS